VSFENLECLLFIVCSKVVSVIFVFGIQPFFTICLVICLKSFDSLGSPNVCNALRNSHPNLFLRLQIYLLTFLKFGEISVPLNLFNSLSMTIQLITVDIPKKLRAEAIFEIFSMDRIISFEFLLII